MRVTKRLTTKEFVEKAINKHGNLYDYSKVYYTRSKDRVTIICKVHGEFDQQAETHVKGAGCKKCSDLATSIKNTKSKEHFIRRAVSVHGDRFDYSKVVYVKAAEKVIIICKVHGEFLQSPNSHTQGAGCKKCRDESFRKKRVTYETTT